MKLYNIVLTSLHIVRASAIAHSPGVFLPDPPPIFFEKVQQPTVFLGFGPLAHFGLQLLHYRFLCSLAALPLNRSGLHRYSSVLLLPRRSPSLARRLRLNSNAILFGA